MNAFREQSAIITGGASGIGRALGEELVARGARVVLADRDGDAARDAAEAINAGAGASAGSASAHTVDVRDAEAVAALVEEVAARQGLDYLFNNAGMVIVGESAELTLEDWQRTLDINLDGVVHGVQAAYPLMVRRGRGHIVNTASLAGLVPSPGTVPYAAAKHAVVGLSTSLRAEAAAYGVRVSVVCPGLVRTPIVEHLELKREAERGLASRSLLWDLAPVRPVSARHAARVIAGGVAKNRGLILITAHARVLWALYRLSPGLVLRLLERTHRRIRRRLGLG